MEYIYASKKKPKAVPPRPVIQRMLLARGEAQELVRPTQKGQPIIDTLKLKPGELINEWSMIQDIRLADEVLMEYIKVKELDWNSILGLLTHEETLGFLSYMRHGYDLLCYFLKRASLAQDTHYMDAFREQIEKRHPERGKGYMEIQHALDRIKEELSQATAPAFQERRPFLYEWLRNLCRLTKQFPHDLQMQAMNGEIEQLMATEGVPIPQVPAASAISYAGLRKETRELPPRNQIKAVSGQSLEVPREGLKRMEFYSRLLEKMDLADAGERFRIYRTMPISEALGILKRYNEPADWTALETLIRKNRDKQDSFLRAAGDPRTIFVSGHLGYQSEAEKYMGGRMASDVEHKVLLEFILKRGTRQLLFSKSIMATSRLIPMEGYAVADKSEGISANRLGIKAEEGGEGYSFGISINKKNPGQITESMRLLHLMIDQVRVIDVRWNDGQERRAPKRALRLESIHNINGAVYNDRDNPGAAGTCLWNILRRHVSLPVLNEAIEGTPFQINGFVDDDQLPALISLINQRLGQIGGQAQIALDLDVFDHNETLIINTQRIGAGTHVIRLGLIFDPIAEEGVQPAHYIEAAH